MKYNLLARGSHQLDAQVADERMRNINADLEALSRTGLANGYAAAHACWNIVGNRQSWGRLLMNSLSRCFEVHLQTPAPQSANICVGKVSNLQAPIAFCLIAQQS